MLYKYIGLFYLLFISLGTATAQDFNDNWDSLPQLQNERSGRDTLEFVAKLIDLEDEGLYDLNFLDIDSKGNLIAFDFGINKIVYFPVTTYKGYKLFGEGLGGGPKEFRNPYDLKFDSNGNIWLTDIDAGRISQWSADGELLQTFPPSKKYVRPARLAVCEDSTLFVLSDQYVKDGIYHHFNFNGTLLKSFKKIDGKFLRFPTYTDGEVDCSNGALYHAGIYKEYVRKYNTSGELEYSRSVIDFEPNPQQMIKEEKEGLFSKWYSRIEEVKRASGDVVISGDNLYVGFSGKKDGWLYYIDMYDKDNGEYLKSYTFGAPVYEFTIKDKLIYVIEWNNEEKNKDLSVYKIP